jgi:hypothetical protein
MELPKVVVAFGRSGYAFFYHAEEAAIKLGIRRTQPHHELPAIGGRLTLKSALGKGTTAELWIPVSTSEIEDKPQDGSLDGRPATAGLNGSFWSTMTP